MVPPMFMCDIHLRIEYYDVLILAKDINKEKFPLETLVEDRRVEPQNIKKRYDELVVELLERNKNYLRSYVDELPHYESINCCGYVDKKSSLKSLMKCRKCRECMVNALCKLSGF
jgi:hypothetical protein